VVGSFALRGAEPGLGAVVVVVVVADRGIMERWVDVVFGWEPVQSCGAWPWRGVLEDDAAEREGKASVLPVARRLVALAAAALRDCVVEDFRRRTRRPDVTFAPKDAARLDDVADVVALA